MTRPWAPYENFDLGEINAVNASIFDVVYDPEASVMTGLSEMFQDYYSHDIMDGLGPYFAVVLKVLSGPQAVNDAATGGNQTKSLSIDGLRDASTELTQAVNGNTVVKVLARVPHFDRDIDWPKDVNDEVRIAAHSEFHQASANKDLEIIEVGSLISIQYSNKESMTGFNGKAAGKILSVHEPASFRRLKASTTGYMAYNPVVAKSSRQAFHAGAKKGANISLEAVDLYPGKTKGSLLRTTNEVPNHHDGLMSPASEQEYIKFNPIKLATARSSQTHVARNCADMSVSVPTNYEQLFQLIPYLPKKTDFVFQGRISTTPTSIVAKTADLYKMGTFKYQARTHKGKITYRKSPQVWKCIAEKIKNSWDAACDTSLYIPFIITDGLRGVNKKGITGYQDGLSLHSLGLAFDMDAHLAGHGTSNHMPVYSVFTGAWTPGFIDIYGEELYNLGVFKTSPTILRENAYQSAQEIRLAENWSAAPSAYKPTSLKYNKIMSASKGSPIISPGSNPVVWLITFCESSGMKWGNSLFLKNRWRGGNIWNQAEKDRIAQIYNIPNFVERINNISWTTKTVENHMHFQYWNGASLISWEEIDKVREAKGA